MTSKCGMTSEILHHETLNLSHFCARATSHYAHIRTYQLQCHDAGWALTRGVGSAIAELFHKATDRAHVAANTIGYTVTTVAAEASCMRFAVRASGGKTVM
jgi:hypothetical protein